MKHNRLLLLLVLLGLVFGAVPALASSVSLSQNLVLGIATAGDGNLTVMTGSYAYAFASAYATNDVTELGPLSNDQTTIRPGNRFGHHSGGVLDRRPP